MQDDSNKPQDPWGNPSGARPERAKTSGKKSPIESAKASYRYWRSRLFYTTLGLVSPLSFPILWYLSHTHGYCRGAMGSGVTCELGAFSSYFEGMSLLFEISLIAVIGLGWVFASVGLVAFWCFSLVALAYALYRIWKFL